MEATARKVLSLFGPHRAFVVGSSAQSFAECGAMQGNDLDIVVTDGTLVRCLPHAVHVGLHGPVLTARLRWSNGVEVDISTARTSPKIWRPGPAPLARWH